MTDQLTKEELEELKEKARPEMIEPTISRGANCPEKPEKLLGQPLGQYHCPSCGMMVVAGLPHPEPSEGNPDYSLLEELEGPFPTAEEADAYLRGEGIIKRCEVCGQDATLTNNFVTYLLKRHFEITDTLRARVVQLEETLKQIAKHKHSQYPSDAEVYKIGVAHGHRCAASLARKALENAAVANQRKENASAKKEEQ